ncbi:immunoglobulin lambda-1 light chain-like [Hemitrygon akajei]|uniref:immunoglobulin lambda-1 light chain-like n=1 Tax=Hemitrygon akajei TaxID=2704970 RepID=UPI003BFA07EC
MSRVLPLLWALLVHLSGILAVPVLNQTSMSGPVSAGPTARLECRMQNGEIGSYYMRWYRQRPGERQEWVLTHDNERDNEIHRGSGITTRFQASRDTSSNIHILTIGSLEPRDSAVYYCSAWDDGFIFGPGTILDIKSSESRRPSVLLLPPSAEETGSGSATLSCLVSGFKPGFVALRWSVDNVETESGVTTGTASPDTDQTYRLISYLRDPTAAWKKGSSYSCSVSHSSLSSPLRHTISSSACSQ